MDYFDTLKKELDRAHAVASEARCKGFDPSDKVEILVAKDVAARVEGLVGPPGIAEVIRKIEAGGQSRTAIAFDLAGRIAAGEFSKGTPQHLMEQAVRTAVGLLTEGVLVAPTEGITQLSINENPDGTDYVSLHFAGPIRSAGGTVAALSVVFADIARKRCGIGNYRPTETEVARYVEEVNVYENRCNHLQYKPPDEHVAHIVRNCPVCIDGDPTEDVEVSVHRDLERVKSNRVRGGIPLVLCEGIAQKAPKVLKQASKYGLDWNWLQDIIKVKTKEDKVEVKPDFTYLEGLVAGRPVFSYPMAKGGFRLRYGRSRTNGIMARNIHPATMVLLDSFPANGTHMKVERPGKGCIVTVCDSIEPPVVRLKDGSVMRARSAQEAQSIRHNVEKILFLGDMLVTFGDFLKSNHPLMPSGYCREWWEAEIGAADLSVPQIQGAPDAFEFSRKNNIPLHPDYTYPWHDLTHEEISSLAHYLSKGKPAWEGNRLREFLLPPDKEKYILENLYVEHKVEGQNVILSGDDAFALLSSLGLLVGQKLDLASFSMDANADVMENIRRLSGITIRRKCPTYVGARMGRPEKAKERIMPGSPNILFPTGSPKNRSLVKLYKSLKGREKERGINVEIARLRCSGCGKPTFSTRCHSCGATASPEKVCHKCGAVTKEKEHCGMPTQAYDYRPLELISIMEKARSELGFMPQDLRGVKGLFSDSRIPERLEKGFFRAKHSVYVYKDGTSRFDATDVPLTHFRISEINQTADGIKALGYTQDCAGKPITSDSQIVALMAQDILVSRHGLDYLANVANFLDDTLVNLYGLHPFYKLRNGKDLIGHMVVGLSPHTSACVLARIIGYTDANVGYAHPYFHTAKRRNCFYPKTNIVVWDSQNKQYIRKGLGELAEHWFVNHKDKIKRLDSNTLRVDAPDGLYTFGIDTKTNRISSKKINYFIKSNPPEKWIKITTTTNRELTVTPDHNILYAEDGKLKSIEAKDLKNGMDLPVCLKLDPPISNPEHLNLAKALCGLEAAEKDRIMIRSQEFFKNIFYTHRKLLLNILPLRNFEKRSPIFWYRSVPLSHFEILVKNKICGFEDLPADARIALKRDNMALPVRIPMNESLMLILGYYVAEGHARKSRSCYQVNFRICNKEMFHNLVAATKNVFGKEPYAGEENTQVCLCSRIIYLLFTKIWGVGANAHAKRVPNLIFSLPDNLVKSFISAYFDGDGSVIAKPPRMHFYSVSKDLLEDFGTLLLRFGIFCRYGTTKPRLPGKKVLERYAYLGKKPGLFSLSHISMYGADLYKFANICTPSVKHKIERMVELRNENYGKSGRFIKYENHLVSAASSNGDYLLDKVKSIEVVSENVPAYCLDVDGHSLEDKNVLLNNQIFTIRCDGDEDAIMLLLDALLNFSRSYLSSKRGGTMDAPLLLTPMINPLEVDDEVHGMEVVSKYPLDFYEACEKLTFPGDVKLATVKDLLGKPEQYGDLRFMFDTTSLNDGPMVTNYIKLDSIPEKIEAEFRLHSLIRAVDSKDAAERLILSHFIPDIYGNLRSFSRQNFRCVDCNEIFRRPPLIGKCSRCGGKIILTINKGGIEKYLKVSMRMIDEYGLPFYLKQRLQLVEKEIDSVFRDEKVEQKGLSDFM